VAARTRLIDDTLQALTDRELGQLVILGAGFDSRPYRLDCLRKVPVFEVDHPDTQIAKRAVLARRLGATPDNVTFVPSDFNLDALAETMAAAGYQSATPTVFLWEGVSNYLTERAVDATLRWCADAGTPGSLLLFTYVHTDALEHPDRFTGAHRLHASLNKVGEQLTFGLDPIKTPTYLSARGLDLIWDRGAAECRARYYRHASRIRGHEFYRIALAQVRESPGSPPDEASGSAELTSGSHLENVP
jgi:methyltransferase (TIGR00027 family)